MQLWLHSIEVFVDRCIPYLLILLAILIIGGIFFPANVASWTEKIEVFDGVVIGFFAVDLAFKYNRVRNIPNFIKKYWLDILATIPFFFVFRFFEGFLELADMLRWERGAEEAALIVHEGIATEKEVFRFVREVEEAGKASRYARMERFLKPLARFPRFLKVFPFFEKSMGRHHAREQKRTMKNRTILIVTVFLMAFALIQLSTSIHHFDNEGFCIQSTEARILDLSSDKANVTAYNTPLHNWTACSVIGADFNHDGIEDFTTAPSCGLILTEPVVQVVYGSNQLEDKIQLDGAEPANITIDIKLEDEVFSLGHTDIDKNGIADLLIGTSTRSLIFYGKEINIPTILLTEDDADIIIYELQLSRHRGIIVSGGDVNGDNFGDIILGVPNVNFSNRLYAGVVHVVYGNNFPHGTIIDIAIEKADITIYGEKENDKLGNDVAIGDINQDGFVDIIIGARKAAGGKGKAYIIYGRRNFPPKHVIDLATEEADITIIGESMDDEFGNSVFGADVNGDGIDDIIIGAMRADASGREKSGKVYVIYGREDFTPKEIIDLSSRAADLTILGQDANFRLGSTVSSGDINADTIGDLLVGSSTPTQAISYVLYGRRDFESNTVIDLATIQANITVYYDDYWLPTVDFDNIVLAQISEPMALAAGDVNGDFVDDLLIGNPFSKPYVLGAGFGTAYVIYGEGCPCNGLLEIKPGQNQGELKHGCSPGTWKIGEKEIGWNQG